MSEHVGIDIGSYAIKLAVAKSNGSTTEVLQLGQVYNPVGQFLPADESEFHKLADAIKSLAYEHKAKGKPISATLPESLAYSSVISLPLLSDAELASSIHWEAEQHIPVPLTDINLEYEVLYKPKKDAVGEKMRVLLVGAKKDVVERLVLLFQTAGLELFGLETNLLSIYRALHPSLELGSQVIAHMGALSTDVLVINQGELAFTYTIHTGGVSLTRAIEKSLGLQPAQAEEYKRAYGLDANQLEGKMRQVLVPVLNIIVAEIKKALQFNQVGFPGVSVSSMTLTGGGAYLPGLATYFTETLGIEVQVAGSLESWSLQRLAKPPESMAVFIPSIGLASRTD